MILVDRTRVPEPEELRVRGPKLLDEAADFFRRPPNERLQERWRFDTAVVRWVGDDLRSLFTGKCAYCESIIGATGSAHVDLFRPRSGAVDLEGRTAYDHYWWLAYDWRNMYLSCERCNRNKGQRFPVKGRRAVLETPYEKLEAERALLLDPCADDPTHHLLFDDKGLVAAVRYQDLPGNERTRFDEPTRGRVTIDTFGLNRSDLVAERSRRAEQIKLQLASANVIMLRKSLEPAQPYLALARQLIVSWLEQQPEELRQEVLGALQPYLPQVEADTPVSLGARQRAVSNQKAWEKTVLTASAEVEEDRSAYYARTSYIESVKIHNIGCFSDLEFDLRGSAGADAPWMMLLGENGTGKTCILKAITMALIGPQRLQELIQQHPEQQSIFRRGGHVQVYLSASDRPLEVRLVKGQLQHNRELAGAKMLMRAYGPSRWFPIGDAGSPEEDEFVRVLNLFSPFIPLASPEEYIATRNRREFAEVARTIKEIFGLKRDDRIYRRKGQLEFKLRGLRTTSLRHLSSGYEALVAVAVDLMQLLTQRWTNMDSAEGICLIDEIGAHLHPAMQMRIVGSLRNMFPRVQFIATTHQPLCLRGLEKGEVLVLRREEEGVSGQVPEESPTELRVDQLLTSRLFGLHSTLDPELEEDYDRYYYLLSRKSEALDEGELEELDRLRGKVGKQGLLGDSRRDQMIYQLIDGFVAKEPFLEPEEREEEEKWTQEQVEGLWTTVGTWSEG